MNARNCAAFIPVEPLNVSKTALRSSIAAEGDSDRAADGELALGTSGSGGGGTAEGDGSELRCGTTGDSTSVLGASDFAGGADFGDALRRVTTVGFLVAAVGLTAPFASDVAFAATGALADVTDFGDAARGAAALPDVGRRSDGDAEDAGALVGRREAARSDTRDRGDPLRADVGAAAAGGASV